jgi:acetylornithine deacetylase/succinyl-diaminopimelate desuccinylase-like protein
LFFLNEKRTINDKNIDFEERNQTVTLLKPMINRERALKLLEESIRFHHPQNDMGKVRAFISEVVHPRITSIPFDEVQIDERGNLIASVGPKNSTPLVVCTYAGVFPAAGMPDPYNPKSLVVEQNGKEELCIWGRGTSEQISAGAALLEAVLSFFENEFSVVRRLIWLTLYSGEMGNHEAINYVFEQYESLGPALLAFASNNQVCLGNLGRVDVKLEVHGRSCHSSSPSVGVNSIEGIYKILERINRLSDLPSDPDLGSATLSPTTIRTSPDCLHTIPNYAEIILDRRLTPGEDPYVVLEKIITLIGKLPDGLILDYDRQPNIQFPHKANPESEIATKLVRAATKILGSSEPVYQRSALDMGFFSHNGYEAVTFGPGDPNLAHSDHELVSLDQYYLAAQVYFEFLRLMLG